MRKIFIKLALLTTFLFNIACSEEFFNQLPTDQLSEDGFYKEGIHFEQAINDGYRLLRTVYGNYYVIGDVATDNAYTQHSSNAHDFISFNESNVNASSAVLSGIWSGSYSVIARANIVMERIETVDFDAGFKRRLIGEARFLRSLMYFNLVRIFGDVPLILKDVANPAEALSYGREPVASIYSQIIKDLKEAEEALPASYTTNEDIGRATKVAVQSLLGHIYLTQRDFSEASKKLKEALDATEYGLLPDYRDIFDADNANNREIIFAVQYARGMDPDQSSPWARAAWPNESVGTGILRLGGGNFLMTDDLDKAFEPEDLRKQMNNYDFETGYSRRYVFTRKYWDNGMTVKIDPGNDWIIYRYADILLLYAEALNELNRPSEAWNYLDQVRKRAGLTTDEAIKESQVLMKSAILNERRLELNCEGHRWFDLLRSGKLIEVMNAHFQDKALDNNQIGISSSVETYELLFPLPLYEVNLNEDKLIQNPGY